jgi:membrane-associated HD superfamily phosphohydrolase
MTANSFTYSQDSELNTKTSQACTTSSGMLNDSLPTDRQILRLRCHKSQAKEMETAGANSSKAKMKDLLDHGLSKSGAWPWSAQELPDNKQQTNNNNNNNNSETITRTITTTTTGRLRVRRLQRKAKVHRFHLSGRSRSAFVCCYSLLFVVGFVCCCCFYADARHSRNSRKEQTHICCLSALVHAVII